MEKEIEKSLKKHLTNLGACGKIPSTTKKSFRSHPPRLANGLIKVFPKKGKVLPRGDSVFVRNFFIL